MIFQYQLSFLFLQADVEISFEVTDFRKAEVLDYWLDPQILCSKKGASTKSALGPFGLLVFASKGLQEYTAVFFRVFRYQRKYLVLMCSDQSRFDYSFFSSLHFFSPSYQTFEDLTTYNTQYFTGPLWIKTMIWPLMELLWILIRFMRSYH